jgi:uncharacterized Tic20 family protein
MRQPQPRNWLLDLAVKSLKYFLLSLAGCTIAYVVSAVLEISLIADIAVGILEHFLVKALVLVSCLIAIAVITESLRY